MPIKKPTITVDEKNKLPHGTVRRAPTGFAHAILLDQMGGVTKWQTVDLYGPMETYTDKEVADWPIVYVPASDEVWEAMNNQPSYRDMVAEEFGQYEGELQGPPETGDRIYPVSAFVVPCKNCEHKQWLHDRQIGLCHFTSCDCEGFEEAPLKNPHQCVPECTEDQSARMEDD